MSKASTQKVLLWIVSDEESVIFVSLIEGTAQAIAKRAERCHSGVTLESKEVEL